MESRHGNINERLLSLGEAAAEIVTEAVKDKLQVTLIINNRAGGNAPLITQAISEEISKWGLWFQKLSKCL
jgi:hypothetical protein